MFEYVTISAPLDTTGTPGQLPAHCCHWGIILSLLSRAGELGLIAALSMEKMISKHVKA